MSRKIYECLLTVLHSDYQEKCKGCALSYVKGTGLIELPGGCVLCKRCIEHASLLLANDR